MKKVCFGSVSLIWGIAVITAAPMRDDDGRTGLTPGQAGNKGL
jgi:hypothetical protein